MFSFGCQGCKFLGVTEKERALTGKGNVATRAVEKANTEFVFQCFDLKRDGGLGEKQLLRRFVEAELFCNCPKHFQPKVLQLGHVTIIDGNRPVAIVYSAAFAASRSTPAAVYDRKSSGGR